MTGSPTIFHITQHKAGSQWIFQLLQKCADGKIVDPKEKNAQFIHDPIIPGMVYPTLYITFEMYEAIPKPADSRRFVVCRDLRDILISNYFSWLASHPLIGNLAGIREFLMQVPAERGLLWILDNWLPMQAQIFASWVAAREPFIKYESLLNNDVAVLENVLIDRCGLEVDRCEFREHVEACRFEKLTGGRERGREDVSSHARKGTSGDWRNYFSPKLKSAFKERYGKLLIAGEYERNNNW